MGAQGGFHIRASLEVHLGSPLFAVKVSGTHCEHGKTNTRTWQNWLTA